MAGPVNNNTEENAVKWKTIVLGICFSGSVCAISSVTAAEVFSESGRHHWRMQSSQHSHAHSHALVPDAGVMADGRYHAGLHSCVEGPGSCDMAY